MKIYKKKPALHPSFVDDHLLGRSVYVNHFLPSQRALPPTPQNQLLVLKVRPHFTAGVSIKTYFCLRFLTLKTFSFDFFSQVMGMMRVSVDALFTFFATASASSRTQPPESELMRSDNTFLSPKLKLKLNSMIISTHLVFNCS